MLFNLIPLFLHCQSGSLQGFYFTAISGICPCCQWPCHVAFLYIILKGPCGFGQFCPSQISHIYFQWLLPPLACLASHSSPYIGRSGTLCQLYAFLFHVQFWHVYACPVYHRLYAPSGVIHLPYSNFILFCWCPVCATVLVDRFLSAVPV